MLKTNIMPALLRKIAEMNHFVQENYYCAGKNVECLSDAQVICLGETHCTTAHRKNNGKLIDELIGSSNSDILLDERTIFKDEKPDIPHEAKPANIDDRCNQTAFVKKPVATWGWDCRESKNFFATLDEVLAGLLVGPLFGAGSYYYYHNNNPIISSALIVTAYYISSITAIKL